MKKNYLKPEVEKIAFVSNEIIANDDTDMEGDVISGEDAPD